jgi:signal transduction histidine kinase
MVGNEIMSTKGSQGLGLGLFIAYTVIKRLGGAVHLYNRESGGVCARLELPLAMMKDDA